MGLESTTLKPASYWVYIDERANYLERKIRGYERLVRLTDKLVQWGNYYDVKKGAGLL